MACVVRVTVLLATEAADAAEAAVGAGVCAPEVVAKAARLAMRAMVRTELGVFTCDSSAAKSGGLRMRLERARLCRKRNP